MGKNYVYEVQRDPKAGRRVFCRDAGIVLVFGVTKDGVQPVARWKEGAQVYAGPPSVPGSVYTQMASQARAILKERT